MSQTRATARPGAIKEGFLGEENLVSTQESSMLHRTLLLDNGLHRFFSSVVTSQGDSLPPLLLRGGNGPPSWPWWLGALLCSRIEKLWTGSEDSGEALWEAGDPQSFGWRGKPGPSLCTLAV